MSFVSLLVWGTVHSIDKNSRSVELGSERAKEKEKRNEVFALPSKIYGTSDRERVLFFLFVSFFLLAFFAFFFLCSSLSGLCGLSLSHRPAQGFT